MYAMGSLLLHRDLFCSPLNMYMEASSLHTEREATHKVSNSKEVQCTYPCNLNIENMKLKVNMNLKVRENLIKFLSLHQSQSQTRVYMVSVGNYRKFHQTFCVIISGYQNRKQNFLFLLLLNTIQCHNRVCITPLKMNKQLFQAFTVHVYMCDQILKAKITMPSFSWMIEQTQQQGKGSWFEGCTVNNGLEKATVPQNCGEINIYSTDPVNSLLFCSIK